MSNPNADRLAALRLQEGTPEADVTAVLASHYLRKAADLSEVDAAASTLVFARDWLTTVAEPETSEDAVERRVLSAFLALNDEGTFNVPVMRLLHALAEGVTENPNPTPAFGASR